MECSKEKKSRVCEFCSLQLENYHLWSQHLRQFHNVVFLLCEYCRLKFPSKSELRNHVTIKHTDGKNPRAECSRCPATFLSARGLEKHVRQKHTPNQPKFACKKCGKVYRSRETCHRHLKSAHIPLAYLKCDKCPKLFYMKQTLRRHKEVEHSANFQRTKCSMCPATYKYREHLSRHMQVKHFSRANCSTVNLNPSLEMSVNKCNICSALYPDKASLLQHRRTFHNRHIDIYHCNQCPAVFKLREAYTNHLREDHGVRSSKYLNIDKKDYVCQDQVDFEYTMLQNFEIRQLMKIRKTRKFSQKLVIVNYNQIRENDNNIDLNLDESELETVSKNINILFDSLCSQYRKGNNISEANSLPVKFYMDKVVEEKPNSEIKYIEIEISGQAANMGEFQDENNLTGASNENNVSIVDHDHKRSSISSKESNDTVGLNKSNPIFNKKIEKWVGTKTSKYLCASAKTKGIKRNKIGQKEHLKPKLDGVKSMFKTKINLDKHKTKPISLHKCIHCEKCFKSDALLVRHVKRMHKNQAKALETGDNLGQKIEDSDKNNENLMFPCQLCQALFPCMELLLNHCLWQHNDAART